jgi:hypothetical protein
MCLEIYLGANLTLDLFPKLHLNNHLSMWRSLVKETFQITKLSKLYNHVEDNMTKMDADNFKLLTLNWRRQWLTMIFNHE